MNIVHYLRPSLENRFFTLEKTLLGDFIDVDVIDQRFLTEPTGICEPSPTSLSANDDPGLESESRESLVAFGKSIEIGLRMGK